MNGISKYLTKVNQLNAFVKIIHVIDFKMYCKRSTQPLLTIIYKDYFLLIRQT